MITALFWAAHFVTAQKNEVLIAYYHLAISYNAIYDSIKGFHTTAILVLSFQKHGIGTT